MNLLLLASTTVPPPVWIAPTLDIAPFVTGTPQVGSVLSENVGAWNGTPSPTTTYLWQISPDGTTSWTTLGPTGIDQNAGTYTIQAADNTKYISILVTAMNRAGTAGPVRSAAVGPVTTPLSPPGPGSPPVIL